MRIKVALMLLVLALALTGCGYMLVEDVPVQVGSAHRQMEFLE